MFARIAGRYDFLNHFLSAGIDKRWRRRTVERAGAVAGKRVVDVCTGTGDLALEFQRAGGEVLGVDFTHEMLLQSEGKRGAEEVVFARGDALRLPARSGSADVVSIAFGIRNVEDRTRGLAELLRVLRPGGLALVLEFTTPPGPVMGSIYRLYFTRILPLVGRLVSRDEGAYTYLRDTVLAWPSPERLEDELAAVGFTDCGHELLTFGIACLHWGTAPAEGTGQGA